MATDAQQGLTDSDKWIVGDISLISADRVRFRVPSRALFCVRYVRQWRR